MGKKKQIIIENLEIKDAGAEGVSVGRHQDTVVFVPYAVPEIGRRESHEKRSYYHAQLMKIKVPSPIGWNSLPAFRLLRRMQMATNGLHNTTAIQTETNC
jgi:hypothetical protein